MGIKVGDMVRLSDGVVGRVEEISYSWGVGTACVLGNNGVVYKEQSIASLQPITPSAPSVSPDVVDRMVRLVRDLAKRADGYSSDAAAEVCAIAALLPPEPVDPLVLRAREICQREQTSDLDYLSGEYDNGPMIRATLRALRYRDPV